MKIKKILIDYLDQKTNALVFLPEINEEEVGGIVSELKSTFVVCTHGYTADKSSILNWPIRLCEAGATCVLFDLPGHYLGNYSEVLDFNHFKNEAHRLFYTAFLKMKEVFLEEFPLNDYFFEESELKLVLSGHSLGALLSLKALMLKEFENYNKLSISVGLGMAPPNILHIFDTPFYKSTLKIREQLVSKELNPENVFNWIKEEKKTIELTNQKIHLITGVDDLVVGNDGMERFLESLSLKGNMVTMEKPNKLPHHEPQLAAAHVKKYLKKIHWI